MNNLTVKQFERAISADGNRRSGGNAPDTNQLRQQVEETISNTPVFDVHTHLFPAQFGAMNLFGIDELLNYHYLIAEFFRFSRLAPEDFWKLEKTKQSDLIWQTLFVENTPLSEATYGVISVLNMLGLDTRAADLREAREFFESQKPKDYIENVLKLAGVSDVVMTNDPLDEDEIKIWNGDEEIDPRFHAALRLDRLLNGWAEAVPLINKQNYQVSENIDEQTITETRRFLDDWITKMKPLYLGVSLPDDFVYPEDSALGKLI